MYKVQFKVDNYGHHTEFTGFENIATAGYFEPGWDINLLFHDIFEHWFENSEYFSTASLSQAGECVALGIRQYFYQYTSLVQRYAAYNKIHGVEWNSWETIIAQVSESLYEDYVQYPNDFNYKHLPQWDKENLFEGLVETYNGCDNIPSDLREQIEMAYSYGYWLGEYMFDDITHLIYTFCENLKLFLDRLGFSSLSVFETSEWPVHDYYLTVDVRKDNIVARFAGCIISAKQSRKTVYKVIKQFENKFQYEY